LRNDQLDVTRQAIVGCLLGTAVGDSIGLPYEGISRRRARRLLGPPDRHRLLFGRKIVSDDTEHTCLVVQALIASGAEVPDFARRLSRGLRWWLLGLPAGVGLATLRACLRLWIGFPPSRSGVWSAGNGPAMRSAVIGAAIADRARLLELVRASTIITHSDPKAYYGAVAVALAASFTRDPPTPEQYLSALDDCLGAEGGELVRAAVASVARCRSPRPGAPVARGA
jgi:ADP-ribosyl-[dinitrogen reductase] hydrolase